MKVSNVPAALMCGELVRIRSSSHDVVLVILVSVLIASVRLFAFSRKCKSL